ncbi:MAG: hypothetical protein JJT94_03225 [Bernardetiaceae bacterium]|nr:hypothetical protein [Bernardetiaceae bacterium]
MQTKQILLSVLFLFLAATVSAQDYAFRVLASKGSNSASEAALRTGSKIAADATIEVAEGGYLGLVHANGKTLEIKEKGTYKVADLQKKVGVEDKGLSSRYAAYVSSEVIKSDNEGVSAENRHKHMGKTGAVVRATGENAIMGVYEKTETLVGEKVTINWFLYEDIAKVEETEVDNYRVVINDLFGNVLVNKEVKSTNYKLDFASPEMKGNTAVVYRVYAVKEGKEVFASDEKSIKRASRRDIEKYSNEASELADANTALGQIIRAQYFEEKGFYADAMQAYETAIDMAPGVEAYEELYNNFLTRNLMSKDAIIEEIQRTSSKD